MNLDMIKFRGTTHHHHANKKVYAKTREILIASLVYLIVLYQHQFPGFGNILWLCKVYHGGKLGEECTGTLLFLQLCVSLKVFQKKEKEYKKVLKNN